MTLASAVTLEARLALRESPRTLLLGHQRWNNLLFLHWQVEPQAVQATLPPGLTVDTHEGAAYVGIVPFFMERVRPRGLPPLPWLSWFLELNVRTYVFDGEGRPGVWFYSLDCNQPIAVTLARASFHLPYFHARMAATRTPERIDYRCQRRAAGSPSASYSWSAFGDAFQAAPGTLEFFLVERYLLFARTAAGRLKSGRVHHQPYRLRAARVAEQSLAPAQQSGFSVAGPPVSALAAEAVDVRTYRLHDV